MKKIEDVSEDESDEEKKKQTKETNKAEPPGTSKMTTRPLTREKPTVLDQVVKHVDMILTMLKKT